MTTTTSRPRILSVGNMTRIAILTAAACILDLLQIPVVAFYKLDFGNVPVLFAKKNKTKNIAGDVYISQAESFTQDRRPYNIFVSKEFLKAGEKVLLMDDFLANGSALAALSDIARQAGAEVVGAAIVIEKAFQPGGKLIRDKGVRVESLAKIAEMSEEKGVVFADD